MILLAPMLAVVSVALALFLASFFGSTAIRVIGWGAGVGAAVAGVVIFISLGRAPHQLAGGDQCPVLGESTLVDLVWLQFLSAVLAPAAVGCVVGARRSFGSIAWFFAFGGLALSALTWFALLIGVGACGS